MPAENLTPHGAGAVDTRSPAGGRVLPGPDELSVARFRVGEDEFAVLSFPVEPRALPSSLTTAEHAVLRAMLRGESNGHIAQTRGTSTRTVANQAQAIFRKLGVHSRAELSALLARTSLPEL
jgi:DNA-binding NarL/FixJ family response regulator